MKIIEYILELIMLKKIFIIFIFVLMSCNEQNNIAPKFKPYNFKIDAKCSAEMKDSILVLKYSIQNLDSINYYLPGSIIWLSGNSDSNLSIASSPGKIYAYHNINFFPSNSKLKAYFELNAKYIFNEVPFFFKIEPNKTFELLIEILPFTKSLYKTSKDYNSDLNYDFQSRFSIINEIDLRNLFSRINLNQIKNKIIVNKNQLYITNYEKELIKKIHFETTNISIDSTKSDLINDYLQNYIEVNGKLINK